MTQNAALASALLGIVVAAAGCAEDPMGPVRMTPDIAPPVLVHGAVPEYTPEALAQGVEGPVAAECMITEEGAVTECRIVQSLPLMDKAVLQALSTWQCSPARRGDEPVAVVHVFHLRLALPRGPEAPPPPGVIPYQEGAMTRPALLVGKDPILPKEAVERRVHGEFVAKCVLTSQGQVTNCVVVRSLPFVDQAMLDALMARRYTPALFQGAPVSVMYTFKLALNAPIYPVSN